MRGVLTAVALTLALLLSAGAAQAQSPPVASITGNKSAVTEGSDATFTVTLAPAPTTDVTVNLTITQTGTFVASGNLEAKTVTVGTTGTATHTVATEDDSTDEVSGKVIATLATGTDYTVASAPNNTASIDVNDNDPAHPTSDTTPPTLVAGRITASGAIDLYFSETLDHTVSPTVSQFIVTASVTDLGDVGGSPGVLGNRIATGVGNPPTANDEVTLAITTTTGIRDLAGNQLEPITSFTLTNTAKGDPGKPALITADGAVVSGDTLTLTYDKVMIANRPPDAAFTVTVTPTPTPAVSVTDVVVTNDHSAGTSTAVLTLSAAVLGTDTVTLSYSTAEDHKPRFQNMWGTWVAALTNQAVTNNTGASITGGSAVTEGAPATFTVTLSPAPTADVTVNLTITQTGSFVASGDLGAKTVTVGTTGTATYTVATEDDSTGETNGTVTATLNTGTGYTLHATKTAASVTVNDDDCTETDTAVSWASGTKTGLASDCTTLLGLKDTLRGTKTLNWSKTVRMDQWNGLTRTGSIAGTAPRVTKLNFNGSGLNPHGERTERADSDNPTGLAKLTLAQHQPTKRADPHGIGQAGQPDRPRSQRQQTDGADPHGIGQPDQPDLPPSRQQRTERADPRRDR